MGNHAEADIQSAVAFKEEGKKTQRERALSAFQGDQVAELDNLLRYGWMEEDDGTMSNELGTALRQWVVARRKLAGATTEVWKAVNGR